MQRDAAISVGGEDPLWERHYWWRGELTSSPSEIVAKKCEYEQLNAPVQAPIDLIEGIPVGTNLEIKHRWACCCHFHPGSSSSSTQERLRSLARFPKLRSLEKFPDPNFLDSFWERPRGWAGEQIVLPNARQMWVRFQPEHYCSRDLSPMKMG